MKNRVMEVDFYMTIGDRKEQQDAYGCLLQDEEGLVVVCDGMGGCKGGKIAGQTVVETMMETYRSRGSGNVPKMMREGALQADKNVYMLKDEKGNSLGGGSTMASVFVKNNRLYWCSVGDSRSYFFRDGECVRFTLDHTYLTVLQQMKKEGKISESTFEFEQRDGRSERLISYLGMGDLQLMDSSIDGMGLQSGDRILLMTDGLYKSLDEQSMIDIVRNTQEQADLLEKLDQESAAHARNLGIRRDNTTMALIQIR